MDPGSRPAMSLGQLLTDVVVWAPNTDLLGIWAGRNLARDLEDLGGDGRPNPQIEG